MEQMSDQDREALKAFANGQAFISGHAVKFPLQVKLDRDEELETSIMGDEDFIADVQNWKDSEVNKKKKELSINLDKVFKDVSAMEGMTQSAANMQDQMAAGDFTAVVQSNKAISDSIREMHDTELANELKDIQNSRGTGSGIGLL